MQLDGLKDHSLSHKMQLLSRLQQKVDLFSCEGVQEPKQESVAQPDCTISRIKKHIPQPQSFIPNYLKYLIPVLDFNSGNQNATENGESGNNQANATQGEDQAALAAGADLKTDLEIGLRERRT